MKVRVKQASNPHCWYSECVGQVFWAFQLAGRLEVWFTPFLFFMPQDIEVVEDPCDAFIPVFNIPTV